MSRLRFVITTYYPLYRLGKQDIQLKKNTPRKDTRGKELYKVADE